MNIILTLLAVALLTFVLNILIIQSNNFIFIVFKKPSFWILFMGLLSFLYFFIGSQFENSFNIIWWSSFLAFLLNIPSKARKNDGINPSEKKKIINEMYNKMGITKGKLKYRTGLIAYVIGGILSWVLFYSEIITIAN